MINIKRIIFSIVLILTVSISLVPTTVHAASELYVNGENISLTPDKEITAGKGYIKYDTKSNTLELNNATIDKVYSNALIFNDSPDNIKISLNGTNRLVVSNGVLKAIDNSHGKLAITGVGVNPTLTISSGKSEIGFTGIMSNDLNINDATINIDSYKIMEFNSAILTKRPINITNSNININNFFTGISGTTTKINDSTLKFNGCNQNIYIEGAGLNINDSKIYSTKNDTSSTLITGMACDVINLTNSKIEANDGSLISGIQAFPELNISNSTIDIISEGPSFGGEQMAVVNSTINALSKNNNVIRILKLLNIKDSIVNAEGGINKAAILVDTDKLGTDYAARITLSDNLYVKNNLKISNSPLDVWFFKTSFIADTETELKTDLSNAASIVN
ncbi:MAG: hypothetical protein RR732_04670, partial [Bacilli bacterium]